MAANSEAGLRAAVAKAVPTLAIDWHIETFREPYCKMLELIRPLVPKFGMLKGGLMLTTDDGATKLFEGDLNRSTHQHAELSFARSIG